MLNEFKKSMWNDGYSKEQPWLNYYNSYERMHCCFGDDGASDAEDSGMTADQAAEVAAAIDAAKAEGATPAEQQNIAEGGNRGAAAGYTGDELEQISAANIDTDFFNDENTLGIGAGSTSGYGSFADPFAESGVGQTSFGSYINDLKDAGAFAAQNVGVTGFISAVARAAEAFGKDEKDVTAQDISMVTGGQNYGGLRSDQSPIAGPTTTAQDLSIAGPPLTPAEVGGATDFSAFPDQSIPLTVTELDFPDNLMSPAQKAEDDLVKEVMAETPRQQPAELNDILAAYEIAERGYGRTPIEFDAGATYGESISDGQGDPGADFGGFEYDLGADFMPGPGQPGYGGAALGGMTDAELQAGYAQEARNISSAIQPNVQGLRSVDSYEPPIIKPLLATPPVPTPPPATQLPAMQAYFKRLGIGPATPARNPSISTYAAAYGLTYDEAAKRFAPPSVPAMGGGGLRGLMEYS